MSDQYLGEIRIFSGDYAPEGGWMECKGQLLSTSQYAALYSLIGVTYGGDGRTTFALPDLRGRLAIDRGQGTGLTNRTLGQSFGTEQVTLLEANLPAHTHAVACTALDGTTASPANAVWARSSSPLLYDAAVGTVNMSPACIDSVGGNQAHDNVQPYFALTFMIATEGVYPST